MFIKFEIFFFLVGMDKIFVSIGWWFDFVYEDIEFLCEKIFYVNFYFLKFGLNDIKYNYNFFFVYDIWFFV